MVWQDRTNEFHSIIKSAQARAGAVVSRPTTPQQPRTQSEFKLVAKDMSGRINETYEKLDRLIHLAKNKSLFDDRPMEINQLTSIISDDMKSLTRGIEYLKETQRKRQGTAQAQKHSNGVVTALATSLEGMYGAYKDVIQVRQKSIKEQQDRITQFGGSSTSELAVAGGGAFDNGGAQPRRRQKSALYRNDPTHNGADDAVIDMGGFQQQSMQLMDRNNDVMEARANAMDKVTETLKDLSQMWTQLSSMVHEQGETIQRIDQDVEDADINVNAAHEELLKLWKNVSSNRWLMAKIFMVIMATFAIFAMIA